MKIRDWVGWLSRRSKVPPQIKSLPSPINPPIPLKRIFPPLSESDRQLASQKENRFSEEEISSALELLRGGLARQNGTKPRSTRPVRFQIALRQITGFTQDCLMVQSGQRIGLHAMYEAYLLWVEDNSLLPIPRSDFDYAMANYLESVGGIRHAQSYEGCGFRRAFARKLDGGSHQEARRRLGIGLDDLMAGKRPGP